MTEYSLPWGGFSTGDASLAPYDDDEFTDWIRDLVTIDRTLQGVFTHLDNGLAITNPSGLTIRVATGKALVDGKGYINDDVTDLTLDAAPGADTDYYTVVLRKDFAAQTVRAVLVGPVNAGPAPAVTQIDGTTWDIALAEVRQTSAGTITIIDKRHPVNGSYLWKHLHFVAGDVCEVTGIPTFVRKIRIVFEIGLQGAELWLRLNGLTANYSWVNREVLYSSGVETINNGSSAAEIVLIAPNSSPFTERGELNILNGQNGIPGYNTSANVVCYWNIDSDVFHLTGGARVSGGPFSVTSLLFRSDTNATLTASGNVNLSVYLDV